MEIHIWQLMVYMRISLGTTLPILMSTVTTAAVVIVYLAKRPVLKSFLVQMTIDHYAGAGVRLLGSKPRPACHPFSDKGAADYETCPLPAAGCGAFSDRKSVV